MVGAQLPPDRPTYQATLPYIQTDHHLRARIPIFYPPASPVPGAEIDRRAYLLDVAYDAPESLRNYIGEVFYPILGARLAEEDLSRRHRTRLSAYVAKRDGLIIQLEENLNDPEALARNAHAGDELEAEAEALRADLVTDAYQWGTWRAWRVDPGLRSVDPELALLREYHALRAGAFFLPALNIDQRAVLQLATNFEQGATIYAPLPAGTRLSINYIPTPEQQERREKARRAIAEGLKVFAEENAQREGQIAQQARDVLGLIMEFLREQAKPGQRPESEWAVEAARLLAAHDQSRRLSKYARYLAATNQPGLSPAQRRLLFGAALRDLDLPLPPGVRRPAGNALDP